MGSRASARSQRQYDHSGAHGASGLTPVRPVSSTREMNQTSSLLVRSGDGARWGRTSAGLLTFGIAIVLFFPGLAVHESLHLVVLNLVGGHGSLVVRPWKFALVDLSLPSLHVQPVPALDLSRQLAVNFFGPAVAAVLFAIPFVYVRNGPLKLALGAGVAVLIFYAVIESAYLLDDLYLNVDLGVLVTPELNYGVPLAICAAAGFLAALRPRVRAR
jgi:hypothetical protein